MQPPSRVHSSTLVVEALEYGQCLEHRNFWQLWSHPDNLTFLFSNDPLVARFVTETCYKDMFAQNAAVAPVFEGLYDYAQDCYRQPLSVVVMPGEWVPWPLDEWRAYYDFLDPLLLASEKKNISLAQVVASLPRVPVEKFSSSSDALNIVQTLSQFESWCKRSVSEHALPAIQLEFDIPMLLRNRATGKNAWIPSVVTDSTFIPF